MVASTNDSTLNMSSGGVLLSRSHCIPWVVVLTAECFAIVILNIVTVVVFATRRELQRQVSFLPIRNLAVVDLLAGAISGPLQIERLGQHCDLWEYDESHTWASHLKLAFLHLFSMASLANLAAISLERMYATLCPFQHLLAGKRLYVLVVIVVWLTATIREIAQIAIYETATVGDAKPHLLVNSTLYLPYYFICLSFICLSYISIFVRVRCSVHPNSENNNTCRRERRLTITLFIVTVASLITLLPVIIFVTANTVHPGSFQTLSQTSYFHVRMFVVMFFLGNSLANPIIYSLRMQGFREGLKALFGKTPGQENTTVFHLRSLTRRT